MRAPGCARWRHGVSSARQPNRNGACLLRKTSRRGTYRHAFYCVGGTAHALAVQRLVARPRCRRLYRAWPLLWLPKPCMQVTSNTRNEAMFREATIFAHQLQVVEKDLVDWQRGIDSSFNNIRNIMLSPLPRVYEEGHNGHAVPSEPEPTSAHACARRVLIWTGKEAVPPLIAYLHRHPFLCCHRSGRW